MNRIKYVLLLCFAMATLGANAQWYQRILLSHKGDLKVYESDQMQAAVNDAVEGDTIYLNDGYFVSSFYIDKPLTIIGSGDDKSTIDGQIYVVIPNCPTLKADLLKGVKIDNTLYISSSLQGVTIRNCKLKSLWTWDIVDYLPLNPNGLKCEFVDSLLLDRCYFEKATVIPKITKNITFKNCHIEDIDMFDVSDDENKFKFIEGGNAKFINCRIDDGDYQNSPYYHTSGLFINSTVNNEYLSSDCVYISCLIKRSWGTWQNSWVADKWTNGKKFEDYVDNPTFKGTDGTVIGIYGGTTPYTLSTTAPKITGTIKTSTDVKRLNVNITVTPGTENAEIVEHQYWMDDDYDKPKTMEDKDGIFTASIHIGSMAMGYHYFNYRAKDSNGEWSPLYRYKFYSLGEDPEELEEPEISGNVYFLQNVETGLFLNQGNGWGTHAILSEHGLPVRFSQLSDGSYTLYFMRGSQYDKLLFRDGADVYVDYDPNNSNSTQWCQYWTITNIDNDIYRIQSLITDDLYGQDAYPGTYLGNNPNKEAYAYGKTDAPLGVYNDVDGNVLAKAGMNINWRLIPVSPKAYLSEYELPSVIATANNLGIDTSKAAAMSGNINANVEEVEACITALLKTIKQQMGQSSASATNPIEVTGLIQNPTFAWEGEEGWTVSEAKEGGSHRQMLGESEYWNSSFNYSQTITGLANGTYQVKVKAFHRPGWSNATVLNNYRQGIDNASAILYGNDESVILANQASAALENPIHYLGTAVNGLYLPNTMSDAKEWFESGYYENTVTVEVTNGKLDIGIKLNEEISGQWVIFDDFRLYYLGQSNVIETDISKLDNAIYIEPLVAKSGSDINLEIKLKNQKAVTAYGFELVLPEGLSITTSDGNDIDDEITLSQRHKGHSVTSNVISNNTYKIAVASTSSKSLTGNDGAVATIKVHVAEGMAEGNYPIYIKNPSIVYSDATKPTVSETTTSVKVENYLKGDVDGDGIVDLADAVLIINYYVGKPVTKFIEKAAYVDNDDVIDLADAVLIINYYVGRIPSLVKEHKGNMLDPQ